MKQPTQLSKEQVQKLFDFTEKNHVKYIDVRYELVDHLATGIETQLKSNPHRDFEIALKYERQKFPLTGFYHFVEEKEKALITYWNKKIWSVLKSYFKLPQILLTLTILASTYIFYLTNTFNVTISIGLALSVIITIYQSYLLRKSKSTYLIIRHFYGAILNVSMLGTTIFTCLTQRGLLDAFHIEFTVPDQLTAIVYAGSVTTMLILLIAASTGQFKKLLMEELQNKYAHLNLSI